MESNSKKSAVSPVIGVILMVAITVILAAIIATYVFGMAGNMQTGKEFAVTGVRNGQNIVMTNIGGRDQNIVRDNSLDVTVMAIGGNLDPIVKTNESTSIGSTLLIQMPDVTLKYNVVASVTFNDGSQQVVFDAQI